MIRMTVFPGLVVGSVVNYFLSPNWVRWLQLEALCIPVTLLLMMTGWLIGEYFYGGPPQ